MRVETDNRIGPGDPQVAVDPDGNATVVWAKYDGFPHLNIWSNRYTPSGGWGRPVVIANDTGDSNLPQVAIDANGNATVVRMHPNI